jgi:hypothetical protein
MAPYLSAFRAARHLPIFQKNSIELATGMEVSPLSINVHFKAGIDSRDGRVRAHAGLSDGTQLDVHKFCASAE